jgi:hypothetical protein
MPASKNFGNSLSFETVVVAFFIASVALYSAYAPWRGGSALLDGDAEAHLNNARRLWDSRTPGPEQLGTAWLPLPHLVMAPFTVRDDWWKNGQAGSIPSSLAFAAAAGFLWASVRRVYAGSGAAFAAVLVFALNDNTMYLAGTPMTEMLFTAALASLLWATLWYRESQSVWALLASAVVSNAASLTRYEGWFLIPFVSAYALFVARAKWHAAIFAILAALAPLAWLAHNEFYYSNALEFYNGPWSAMAIHLRQLAKGVTYPTADHWGTTLLYFLDAVRGVVGLPVAILAIFGLATTVYRRVWWPVLFLSLAPIFYLWSLHSGAADLYVPQFWPYTAYNLRYAFPALLLASVAVASLFTAVPNKFHVFGPAALLVVVWNVPLHSPYDLQREADFNSRARRAVQKDAATFLASNYQTGSGIFIPLGDFSGVLREAGIPFREALHEGNHPAWDAAAARPGMFLREEWAVAAPGSEASAVIAKAIAQGRPYRLRKRIVVRDSAIEIYHLE